MVDPTLPAVPEDPGSPAAAAGTRSEVAPGVAAEAAVPGVAAEAAVPGVAAEAAARDEERIGLPLILVLTLVVTLAGLSGGAGLHQNDEDLYFGIATSMHAQGAWLVPSYLGAVDFHKPPLLYWMMLACMKVLGPSMLAARLPVALCGLLLVGVTHLLASDDEHPRVASLAAGMLATSLGFFQYARAAMMDIPLALAFAVSLLGLLQARQARRRGPWTVALGCVAAFLLKGPVGAVLVVCTALLWWLSVRSLVDEAPSLAARAWLLPALTACALLLAWPVLLALHGLGGAWYERFIVAENLGKFTAVSNSTWVMLKGFAGHLAPWTVLMGAGALATALRTSAPRERLLMCAGIATIGLYCLPAVKWSQYLLPALPPLAILAARSMVIRPSWLVWIAGTLSGLLIMALGLPLVVAPRLFGGPVELALLLTMAASLLVGGALLIALWRPEGTVLTLFVVQGALALLAPRLALDVLPATLVETVGARRLVVYQAPPYRFSNLLGRAVEACDDPAGFRQAFAAGAVVVVGTTDLARLQVARAVDVEHTEVLLSWTRWRRHLRWSDIQRGLQAGSTIPLVEDVNLVVHQLATPPPLR